jgi:cell division protein FtsB
MDELFGMMKIAKTQQEAVQAAIDGLAAERAALAKERATLAATLAQQTEAVKSAAGGVSNVAASIRQAASDAIPAIQKAAGEAVGASVSKSLAGASDAAAKAIGEAARPVIGSLSGVVRAARDAEGSMRNAGAWFAWKWVAVAAGGLVGVCLVAYASLAWQLHQVSSLRDEKASLAADVAQLQANVAALEKKGGRIVMSNCGGRLCIEASSNQGQGSEHWHGANWSNKDTGVQLVIPRGY